MLFQVAKAAKGSNNLGPLSSKTSPAPSFSGFVGARVGRITFFLVATTLSLELLKMVQNKQHTMVIYHLVMVMTNSDLVGFNDDLMVIYTDLWGSIGDIMGFTIWL